MSQRLGGRSKGIRAERVAMRKALDFFWVGFAGLPSGFLAALMLWEEPSFVLFAALGFLFSGSFAAVVYGLWHWGSSGGQSWSQLLRAAGWGWLAWPACGAAWLDWAPGAAVLLVLALAVQALVLVRVVRAPAGARKNLFTTASVAVLVGSVAVFLLPAVPALWQEAIPAPTASLSAFVYEVDAAVATQPLLRCAQEPKAEHVLWASGAHPRLSADDRFVWFDALAKNGRRQIHRLERANGEVRCWTCGEAGNNFYPALGPADASLVFVTDRFATRRHPWNTELQLMAARGEPAPSRRLTFESGPDEFPLLAPTENSLLWSHGRRGHFSLVMAGIRRGHGGVVLGSPRPLVVAGSAWIAPLAWSSDARSLFFVRGNPFAPLTMLHLDPATGQTKPFSEKVAWPAGVALSKDGAFSVISRGHATRRALAWVPGFLSFSIAPLALKKERQELLFEDTELRLGIEGETILHAMQNQDWKGLSGMALSSDGRVLVLGQRRSGPAGLEERLLEVSLACEPEEL